MHTDYVFIKTLSPNASTRDRELQRHNARRHAALVYHSRDKARRQTILRQSKALTLPPFLPPSFTLSPDGTTAQSQSGHTTEYCLTSRSPDADSEPVQLVVTETDEHGSICKVLCQPTIATVVNGAVQRRSSTQRQPVKLYRQISPMQLGPSSDTPSFARARDYFFGIGVPNNFPIFEMFNVANYRSHIFFDLLREDLFRNAWMGLIHIIRSTLSPNPAMKQEAWRHRGIAFAHVRQSIACPNYAQNSILIPSVVFLAWTARTSGDFTEVETHKRVLAVLVQKMGGLDKLGFNGHVKACVLQFEALSVIDSGQSIFGRERHTQSPVYPTEPMSTTLHGKITALPAGFSEMASSYILPLDLIDILSRVTGYLETSKREQLSRDVNVTWDPHRNMDFWEACSSLAIPGVDFNKFLALTLLLYIALDFSPIRSALRVTDHFSIPRSTLLAQIHLLKVHVSHPMQRECWIWMYMVLLDAWSENGELMPEAGQVLLMQFLDFFPDIRSWNALEAVLRRFFWTDKFKRSCYSSWDALTLARGARDFGDLTETPWVVGHSCL